MCKTHTSLKRLDLNFNFFNLNHAASHNLKLN